MNKTLWCTGNRRMKWEKKFNLLGEKKDVTLISSE